MSMIVAGEGVTSWLTEGLCDLDWSSRRLPPEVLQVGQFVIKAIDMWLHIENIGILLMRTRFNLGPGGFVKDMILLLQE